MNSGRTLIKALTLLTMLVILAAGLYPEDFSVTESISLDGQNGLQGTNYALADTDDFLPHSDIARLNQNGFGVNLQIQTPEQFPNHFMVIASVSTGDAGSQFVIGQWRETIIVMNGYDFSNRAGTPRLGVNTKQLAAETQPLDLQFRFSPNAAPATAEVFYRGERVVNYTDVYAFLPEDDEGIEDNTEPDNTDDNNASTRDAYITFTNASNREHGWPGKLQAFELFEKADGSGDDISVASYDFTSDPVNVNSSLENGKVNLLANYQIREPRFLKRSTGYFSKGKRSMFDIALNFFGFIPLGLLLILLVRKYNGRMMSVFQITMAGLAISLLVELVQGVLPSRDSTLFDVFFNTSGAFYGGLLGLLVVWMVSGRKASVADGINTSLNTADANPVLATGMGVGTGAKQSTTQAPRI